MGRLRRRRLLRQAPRPQPWLSFQEWLIGLTLVSYPLGVLVSLFSAIRVVQGSDARWREAVGLGPAPGCVGLYLWLRLAQAAFEWC